MKTLIESTATSATYEFSNGTTTRTVTYVKPEREAVTPDFEQTATVEYADWLAWLGATE